MSIWQALPSLSALRAFAALAEAGSMSAAGSLLNVTHAAISQQVRSLEEHLGVALLERNRNPPRLTDEGERLARALRDGFAAMAAAVAYLTGADARRPVQVTTSPSFAASWLLPRLAGFRAAHPGAGLMLDPTVEVRALGTGGIDLALRYGRGDWPGLEARLLFASPLVVVAAPDLVRDVAQGDLAALASLPWIEEPGTPDSRIALFQQGGITPSAAGDEASLLSLPGNLMIEAARAGQGIAIVAEMSVASDLAAGRLRALHRIDNGKGYWLVHRPGPLRPAARDFARWILREARAS